ncbi:Uncharacterised protein [Vibrio cholerae]|uniref:Uncharacterized protein n=1 Tax=Vibrio cholerae TaxID=666 RepID=A0A656A1F3_VIBCL|nr:Uncharacterised protein [Vibrio cholerae]CSB28281.1 Uncharacterised protein [Vibrio cholerae]CSB66940.1 Uncharacterised protein [Vibrio cholerae]CSB74464.1 Uncharacterised protein [Vibrio cholerae]CSC01135.1 Uncharacterised protein [Vibrio cholerae]
MLPIATAEKRTTSANTIANKLPEKTSPGRPHSIILAISLIR